MDLNSLEVGLFLAEDPHAEVSILVGLEGGRDDQILAGRQRESAAHFPQVDEGFRSSGGGVAQEEVPVQVDVPLAAVLTDTRGEIRLNVSQQNYGNVQQSPGSRK